MEEKLTVQSLINTLMKVEDKSLPIAIREGLDEYWGKMFGKPWTADIRTLQINGPKNHPIPCFFIGQE